MRNGRDHGTSAQGAPWCQPARRRAVLFFNFGNVRPRGNHMAFALGMFKGAFATPLSRWRADQAGGRLGRRRHDVYCSVSTRNMFARRNRNFLPPKNLAGSSAING